MWYIVIQAYDTVTLTFCTACPNCDKCQWSTTNSRAECDVNKCSTGFTRKTTGVCQRESFVLCMLLSITSCDYLRICPDT